MSRFYVVAVFAAGFLVCLFTSGPSGGDAVIPDAEAYFSSEGGGGARSPSADNGGSEPMALNEYPGGGGAGAQYDNLPLMGLADDQLANGYQHCQAFELPTLSSVPQGGVNIPVHHEVVDTLQFVDYHGNYVIYLVACYRPR